MYKKSYNNLHKKSLVIAMCCAIAGNIVLIKPAIAKDDTFEMQAAPISSASSENYSGSYTSASSSSDFYEDLKVAQKASGFSSKIPTFIPSDYKLNPDFAVSKISDKDKALQINFTKDKDSNNYKSIQFYASQVRPSEFLKYLDFEKPSNGDTSTVIESSEDPLNIGDISGFNVDVKVTYLNTLEFEKKYYEWQDGDIWYSIAYDQPVQIFDAGNKHIDLSNEDLGKIVASIKYPEETGYMYNIADLYNPTDANNSVTNTDTKNTTPKTNDTKAEDKKIVQPTSVKLSASSTSAKCGTNVTLRADIGQKTPGVKVFFDVQANTKIELSGEMAGNAVTDANGIAEFVYTRWVPTADTATVYLVDSKTVTATTSTNWSN